MNNSKTILLDAGVAAGLVVALLLVIGFDKLIPSSAGSSSESGSGVTIEEPVIHVSKETAARPLRLAVTETFEEFIKTQTGG